MPHVLALRASNDSPASLGDDFLGGYLAARHLIDLGHRDIGLIAGPEYASTVVGRIAGFHQALDEAGISRRPEVEHMGSFSMEAGEEGCLNMMQSAIGQRPTAIFAMNDNTAVGALSALTRMEIRRPKGRLAHRLQRHPGHLTTAGTPDDPARALPTDRDHRNRTAPAETNPRRRTRAQSFPTLIPRQSTAPPRSDRSRPRRRRA